MSTEIKLPELGENIEGGDVLSILVEVGQEVDIDTPLMEIETDKATLEVPSTAKGTVEKILVEEGSPATVGQAILVLSGAQGSNSAASAPVAETTAAVEAPAPAEPVQEDVAEAPAPTSGAASEITVTLPELGEGIAEGTVLGVLVSVGDSVDVDQGLLEVETDKATIEVPASEGGVVQEILVEEGASVAVGAPIFKMTVQGGSASTPIETPAPTIEPATSAPAETPAPTKVETVETSTTPAAAPSASNAPMPKVPSKLVPASPATRHFAFEIGIEIGDVTGSGPGGRISIDDVKKYAKGLNQNRGTGSVGTVAFIPLPDFSAFGSTRVEKMKKIREVTAKHMVACWSTIPHVTHFDKADITDLEAWRKSTKGLVEKQGAKLTVTAILAKVLTSALQKFPQFNSSINMETLEVIYKEYYNVGIAVDTPNGLMVPVIKGTDHMTVTDICLALTEIGQKARDRKIAPNDLQGGSMTISNLGGIGGTAFTPIVNAPEVAILGVSKSEWEPVFNGKEFEPRLRMPLSLSYDHRIIDGADAARFMSYICKCLENPFNIIL